MSALIITDEMLTATGAFPSGKETKKLIKRKGLKEPYSRMIKVDKRTSFGTREPFVSEERDKELKDAWVKKTNYKTFEL